jgi:hypothetical protein
MIPARIRQMNKAMRDMTKKGKSAQFRAGLESQEQESTDDDVKWSEE